MEKIESAYLNRENIERSTEEAEYHPLKPFLPTTTKVLFLGSFPPQRKRWCMNFYYPNFINDHWRIMGSIFFNDKNHFVDNKGKMFRLESIVEFLQQKGIGYFDTATAVKRLADNASDKFLEVLEYTDIDSLLRMIPQCGVVVTTGEKATQNVMNQYSLSSLPSVGGSVPLNDAVVLYRLPSSSRAYPLSLDKKVEAYRKLFEFAGIV
ncbi:MAG: uracil-DNA glycosylase family protein [Bacteroidales bacterium]|nr:uracil-DNA glycosylase family protein [Bacteroidales bacterium]